MNMELFNEMMKRKSGPRVRKFEWRVFLEFCERYLEDYEIEKPVVVELGIFKGRQRKFYERLFDAEYIGIDILDRYLDPEIQGDTHDVKTLNKLKKILNGRAIDILFIDASHTYESVKKDFEMYSPLCTGVVGFHDIESGRYSDQEIFGAYRFWEELKNRRYPETNAHENYVFSSVSYAHFEEKIRRTLGIGIMLKR
ncbi:MAG: class I SAM-dependent methyltransferase [Desulfobacterales bacterium]|nr:class I SAM-dependent methyltransferase [Desulfobacterales bacterium]